MRNHELANILSKLEEINQILEKGELLTYDNYVEVSLTLSQTLSLVSDSFHQTLKLNKKQLKDLENKSI